MGFGCFFCFFVCLFFVVFLCNAWLHFVPRIPQRKKEKYFGAMDRRIDPLWWTHLSYFSFQPVLHDWCNKSRGMCYPVCGIKEALLLIEKSNLCGGSGFPLSLSEWSFTICPTLYNRK